LKQSSSIQAIISSSPLDLIAAITASFATGGMRSVPRITSQIFCNITMINKEYFGFSRLRSCSHDTEWSINRGPHGQKLESKKNNELCL
jgi:hypothetical protein